MQWGWHWGSVPDHGVSGTKGLTPCAVLTAVWIVSVAVHYLRNVCWVSSR